MDELSAGPRMEQRWNCAEHAAERAEQAHGTRGSRAQNVGAPVGFDGFKIASGNVGIGAAFESDGTAGAMSADKGIGVVEDHKFGFYCVNQCVVITIGKVGPAN